MKKVLVLTLFFLMICSHSFATVKLNPIPGLASDTFSHDYGLMSIGEQYTATVQLASGLNFAHIFAFELPKSSINVSSNPINLVFNTIYSTNISGFTTELWRDVADDVDQWIATGVDFKVLSLLAGDYYIKIFGEVDGTLGGVYALDYSVAAPAPVPVPAAAFLLGAGLLGIVGIRRRQVV